MRRLAMLLVLVGALAEAAQKPLVRASLDSAKPITVGEQVRVKVEVLVPNYFMGEPVFPQVNIDNAVAMLPEERPENLNATIDGAFYAGIARTYVVYPQQPGSFTFPSAQIEVKYASDPPNSATVSLAIPKITFNAVIPRGAEDLDYFLPTPSLTVTQKLDRPLKDLKTGDTITRTVTVTARRLRAMLIPPTRFLAADGVAVYTKEPRVTDIANERGDFMRGERVDAATYLIQKPGDYTLPEISIRWWNVDTRSIQTATIPAISFSAVPDVSYTPAIPPELPPASPPVHKTSWRDYVSRALPAAALLLAVTGLVALWLLFGPGVSRYFKELWRARAHSEKTIFGTLRRACAKNQPHKAYSLLLVWVRIQGPSAERFLQGREVEGLARSLYYSDRPQTWSGRDLAKALNRYRALGVDDGKKQATALPPLNPS